MEQIYSDTSVLLSYVQHWVEQNEVVLPLVNSENWDLHAGETVESEFSERREVRDNLYRLLLSRGQTGSAGEDTESPIESMDVADLPYVEPPPTSNDFSHFEELIEQFQTLSAGNVATIGGHEIDYQSPEDNAFILREYMAEARSRTRDVNQQLTICEEECDGELKSRLNDIIDNVQDSTVLAEAVAWRYEHSDAQPDKLVTLDLRDMYNQKMSINETISDVKTDYATLDIVRPIDIIS